MSKSDKKSRYFTFRLTDGELELIHQRAKEHGFVARSSGKPMPGRYVREKVFNDGDTFITLHNVDRLFEWRGYIRKLETNINQVARIANFNVRRYSEGETEAYHPIPPARLDDFNDYASDLKGKLDELEDLYKQILSELKELKEKHGISLS